MAEDLIESLADALFLGRVGMGATVEEIAELVDVDRAAIVGFERGEILPTPNALVGLAGVLALDVGRLLELYV